MRRSQGSWARGTRFWWGCDGCLSSPVDSRGSHSMERMYEDRKLGQEVQIWRNGEHVPHTGPRSGGKTRSEAPGEDEGAPGTSDTRTEDLRREEEDEVRSQQVRIWATAKLTNLVEALEPYIDGTLGQISPRHAGTYLQATRELIKLWSSVHKPPVVPTRVLEQLRAEAVEVVRAEAEAAREAALEAEVVDRERELEQARREALEALDQLRRRG